MSIYATIGDIGIRRFGDEAMIEIRIQAVPPPVDPNGTTYRAVFFVEAGTTKGTERCGQEYDKPLLMLTGQEYESIRFQELLN